MPNVFLVVRDEFANAIITLPDEGPWTFRDNGGWSPINQQNSGTVIDDALLKPVPEDAEEDLVDLWDRTDGISEETGYYWSAEELEEYLQ